jgi:predicted DNA-binding transcriptional regulator AlpA
MEEIKLIRFKQLRADFVPRGRTTLWQMVRDKQFPAPVRIGKNGIAWRSDEIQAWIKSREKAN